MFQSFISKFIFFFWFFFLLVTVPIYLFTNYQFREIIKTSEQEKITITLNTLKPIISIHLYLNQDKQLNELLNNMFTNNDIKSVQLISDIKQQIYSKSIKITNLKHISSYKSEIIHPLNNKVIANIYIAYSNESLIQFYDKIFLVLLSTFIFSLIIFSIVFFYIRYDLVALRNIATSLQEYSSTKKIITIVQSSRSKEILTIANVANQMFLNIAEYVKELKLFNTKLEERVKSEINKQQNQERLMVHQSRQAAMGEMLESIAHQWRQPLNIITLAAANLETEYDLGLMNKTKFHEKMEMISLNINYMSDTIDDFRDFLNPNREMYTFNAKKSIHDVLNILSAQLKHYDIQHSFNVHDEVLLYGVENEFKQVILILINNSKDAIKIQKEKHNILHGNIKIDTEFKDNQITLSVCDNGGGVDEDIIDSIFNPYFSTKHNANGTGIGLYIAKNIIESRMKGHLSVKNNKGGCCFLLKLPLGVKS